MAHPSVQTHGERAGASRVPLVTPSTGTWPGSAAPSYLCASLCSSDTVPWHPFLLTDNPKTVTDTHPYRIADKILNLSPKIPVDWPQSIENLYPIIYISIAFSSSTDLAHYLIFGKARIRYIFTPAARDSPTDMCNGQFNALCA